MNGTLIHYNGNHYIVVEDGLVDGDLCVMVDKKRYKVLWCYEKTQKYARIYRTFLPFSVTGVTAHTIAQDLVRVAPIDPPIGGLFFMDYVHRDAAEM